MWNILHKAKKGLENLLFETNKKWFLRKWLYFFLLIGMPFLIHSFFSFEISDGFWQPKWKAGELLQYYGFIVGAVATIIAVIVTLHQSQESLKAANEKQLLERKLTQQKTAIDEIIMALNPDHLLLLILEAEFTESRNTFFKITRLDVESRNLIDRIKLHLLPQEYIDMGELLDNLLDCYFQQQAIGKKFISAYQSCESEKSTVREEFCTSLRTLDETVYQSLIKAERVYFTQRFEEL